MLEHEWNEFTLGCDVQNVIADYVKGRGRILRATCDIGPDERILSAPVECKVHIPSEADHANLTISCGVADHVEEVNKSHVFSECFGVVYATCQAHGIIDNYDAYWAALLSLTADEGPEGASWPCISTKTQSRLLMLYKPEYISSFCRGRRLIEKITDDERGTPTLDSLQAVKAEERHYVAVANPKYTSRIALTRDVVVESLCKDFRLRVSPVKLEDLVLVWMYNSFSGSLDPDIPDDGSVVMALAPALCSHSCTPSAYWEYGEEGYFNIFAGIGGLKAGEEITICYLSKKLICELNTLQRRDVLACSWLFFCQCEECASLAAPVCPVCTCKCKMEAFVCWCEEALYPASSVCCSSCHREDLQGTSGYFFHCPCCSFDLCPSCGAWVTGMAACPISSDTSFSGWWMHKDMPEKGIELIIGDTLRWHAGSTSKVTVCSGTCISIFVEGCTYEADLVDEELIWSDGETWLRQT